jgi:hypothetical protein
MVMRIIHLTDESIKTAAARGTLRLVLTPRGPHWGWSVAIEDEHGLIETATSLVAAEARIWALLGPDGA